MFKGGTFTNYKQKQMSDDLYLALAAYCKKTKQNLKGFGEQVRLPYFLLEKVANRKIKMNIALTFLQKIADEIGYKERI